MSLSRWACRYQCADVGQHGFHFDQLVFVAFQVVLVPNQSSVMVACGLKTAKPSTKLRKDSWNESEQGNIPANGQTGVGLTRYSVSRGDHSSRTSVPEKTMVWPFAEKRRFLLFGSS